MYRHRVNAVLLYVFIINAVVVIVVVVAVVGASYHEEPAGWRKLKEALEIFEDFRNELEASEITCEVLSVIHDHLDRFSSISSELFPLKELERALHASQLEDIFAKKWEEYCHLCQMITHVKKFVALCESPRGLEGIFSLKVYLLYYEYVDVEAHCAHHARLTSG